MQGTYARSRTRSPTTCPRPCKHSTQTHTRILNLTRSSPAAATHFRPADHCVVVAVVMVEYANDPAKAMIVIIIIIIAVMRSHGSGSIAMHTSAQKVRAPVNAASNKQLQRHRRRQREQNGSIASTYVPNRSFGFFTSNPLQMSLASRDKNFG